MEVIELGFGVVDIAAVAQGVMGTQGGGQAAGGGQDVAPCIVGVAHYLVYLFCPEGLSPLRDLVFRGLLVEKENRSAICLQE